MKLPSFNYLIQQTLRSFKGHPMVIISAGVAVFFAIFLVEHESDLDNAFPYINLLLCGYLGVPLFIAVDNYAIATSRSVKFKYILYPATVVVLIGIYFYLPDSEETLNKSIPYIRYTILAIAAHLLVSFNPFLSRGTLNGFWHFNRVLFLRFLLSALYAAAFYTGLVLALFALKVLFDVDIKEVRYFQLWVFMAGVFNTWFFVAGLPRKYDELDSDLEYPKGLRTFILYVFIPLLALYFLILYSYSFKIIGSWDWPKGIISYMIIAVAVLGILAMLLSYPYDKEESGGPLKFLQKGYFWVLIPMIIMLYLAIGIRVADYGVTINRYITIFLAVWLTGISIYMVAGGKDIRVIPVSLFAIIMGCSFGPWGLFSVSERSQVNRLETVLENAGILEDGKIVNEPIWDASDTTKFKLDNRDSNEGILSDSLHNEVMSILGYLEEFHGLNAIEGWYRQNPREIARELDYSEDFVAMELMGLPHVFKYADDEIQVDFPTFYSYAEKENLLEITGYDYLYQFNLSNEIRDENTESIVLDNQQKLLISLDKHSLSVSTKEDLKVSHNLDSLYQVLKSENQPTDSYSQRVHLDDIMLQAENDRIRTKLIIESLSANEDGVIYCNGKLLFGFGK
ncbi:MAG: DUF4153 domain-containing protein [Bacteroidota bacterium]